MLINSFPHPAVTGSDLAATLTENKTINVTCRPENASTHTHKLRRYILLLYAYNIGIHITHSPRIDLYDIIYRYVDRASRYIALCYYDDKSYISYAHTRALFAVEDDDGISLTVIILLFSA